MKRQIMLDLDLHWVNEWRLGPLPNLSQKCIFSLRSVIRFEPPLPQLIPTVKETRIWRHWLYRAPDVIEA